MFKQRRINDFIEKYGWELSDNDFEELEEFLNKLPNFSHISKKINKLSKRERNYILLTINNYKKHHFSPEQVETIINDKLNFIKKNKDNLKYIDFDHLYYALNSNEKVYRQFINEYQSSKDEGSTAISLASYYEVIDKYYKEFHNAFEDVLDKKNYNDDFESYIYSLKPGCLCSFFGFTKENKIPVSLQKKFFKIIKKDNEYFDKLSIRDFNDILEFIFKYQDEVNRKDILDKKLTMVMYFKDELKNNWNYLNALGNLPDDYIMGIFKEDNLSYDINFINLLKESDNHIKLIITDFISGVKSHYNDEYYKILNSYIFNKLSSNTIEIVLEKIKSLRNESIEVRKEKFDFIMSCAVLDNEGFIMKSLDFIEKDEDIRLISTKINCVKNIIPHIYNNELPIKEYNKYLEILNSDLEGKNVEEQVDILEAKNKYFEKMDSYRKISNLNKDAISLLVDENNRNTSIYKFLNQSADYYEENITKDIIKRLTKLQKDDDKEMYINFIIDEFFVSSDENRKKVLLNLFDINSISIDFEENNENTISVSPYVHRIVSENNGPMEFVNKDTGLKIFVKTNQKD